PEKGSIEKEFLKENLLCKKRQYTIPSGSTPLAIAKIRDNKEIMQLLLQNGAR
ncbi:MAG: ankyrin repeat domain-containing protein, partial [bacterium]|nr:ankyrin repeat domain-containing protein [bacterium]